MIADIFNYFGFGCFLRPNITPTYLCMYMLRAKPWARTRGVEEHSSLEHIVVRSGVHTYKDQCVHTYKDQCALHIHGALCAQCAQCALHIHGALCAHTQVEIVVVWTSDGADVVLSLGRGSETGCSEQLNKQINSDESFLKKW